MERRKRRWWTRGITWLSVLAIGLALISGLFQLAVWAAPEYRVRVEQLASDALGQPVRVQKLALAWRWLWPLLELDGVEVLDAQTQAPVLSIGRARLGFSLGELLHGDWVPAEVSASDFALTLVIDADGHPHVAGFKPSANPPTLKEVLHQLGRFSRIRAEAVALTVQDQRSDAPAFTVQLHQGDLRLTGQGFEWRSDWRAPGVVADQMQWRAGVSGPLDEPEHWDVRWMVEATNLNPGGALAARWPALKALRFDAARLRAAGDWLRGVPGEMDLSLSARAIERMAPFAAKLTDLDIGVHVRPSPDGGVVDVAPLRLSGLRGPWPAGTARFRWTRASDDTPGRYALTADNLRLDDLSHWLAGAWTRDAHAAERVSPALIASATGDVRGLDVQWQDAATANGEPPDTATATATATAPFVLKAQFENLGLGEAGAPHFNHLAGTVQASEQGGTLTLKGQNVQAQLPAVIETLPMLDKLEAEASWQHTDGGWQVQLPHLALAVAGASLEGKGEIADATTPARRLKLDARFAVRDAAALKGMMPLHWGASLKDWLNRAVLRAPISDGELAIDGPLKDFPFHKNPSGRWSLGFRISNGQLAFHPDWPSADNLSARLQFAGNGLHFTVDAARIGGVRVDKVDGQIEDFADRPLLLDGHTAGPAPPAYELLRRSPLAPRLAGLLNHTRIDGDAAVDVHLEVPLHHDPQNPGTSPHTLASGSVQVDGVALHHDALDAPVTELRGTLQFGGHGVTAEGLTGRFYDTPLKARIAPNAQGADELGVSLTTAFAPDDGLAAHYVPGWLRQRLLGSAAWQLRLPLSGSEAGHVQLDSDLVGTALQLPPPLAKAAESPQPVRLAISSDDRVALRVVARVPDKLGLQLRFGRDANGLRDRATAVRLGSDTVPGADEDGLRVVGALDRAALGEWLDLIGDIRAAGHVRGGAAEASAGSLPFLGVDLAVRQLLVAGYQLPPVRLVAAPAEGDAVRIMVNGEGNAGSVRVDAGGDTLQGQFSRLSLVPPTLNGGSLDAAAQAPPTDPGRLPTLDLAVGRLQLGDADFGQLGFTSQRIPGGLHIRMATQGGGIAELHSEGDWLRQNGMTQANARFTLATDDLAGTLKGLGFAETVSGRNTKISGDLAWPDAAQGFSWSKARGSVSLAVENGALRSVEPGGASRVLGLFNFYALPRRLLFDFRDVVSKGLNFDRVDGHFQLGDGVAETSDLKVKSPSLQIAVQGKLGLAARDYDQVITVTPNTSGLTLGALLAGGTAAAVAGPFLPLVAVIANQVLDKPIGQATQLQYRLTGSWDNPEIRKLDGSAVSTPAVAPVHQEGAP